MSSAGGKACETCYGEGRVPSDEGMIDCPDCGGAGTLPSDATAVEWKLRAIEQVHVDRGDQIALDIRWLAFELRRAREALVEALSLAEDMDESPTRSRLLFVSNRALNLYDVKPAREQSR